jgi:hypothetical protein
MRLADSAVQNLEGKLTVGAGTGGKGVEPHADLSEAGSIFCSGRRKISFLRNIPVQISFGISND